MATLANLEDQVRRRLGLNTGIHTITCNASDPANLDTITINGIVLTLHDSAQTSKAHILRTNTDTDQDANISTAIANIFDASTGVTSTNSGSVVTISGARTVSVSNTTAFTVGTSSTEDEPPYTSDIDQWLLDSQIELMEKLPLSALIGEGGAQGGLLRTVDITLTSPQDFVPLDESEITSIGTVFRVVTFEFKADSAVLASDSLEMATKIPYDLMRDIKNGDNPFYNTNTTRFPMGTKWYSIYDNRIHTNCNIETGAGDARLLFVKYPQEGRGTECDMPEYLQPAMVNYAAANAYEQLGDLEMASKLKQEYMAELQVVTQRFSLASDRVKQEVAV